MCKRERVTRGSTEFNGALLYLDVITAEGDNGMEGLRQ